MKLSKKWGDFFSENDAIIKDEAHDSCKINRDVIRHFCNFLDSKNHPKNIVIKTEKYYDPKPNSWFRYTEGRGYIVTNNGNYKNIHYSQKLEIEKNDFSAFMLAYARYFYDQNAKICLVTNEEELLEFTNHFENIGSMLIPMLLLYSFRENTHNILSLLNRIRKFLSWKKAESDMPGGKSKYWQSTFNEVKDVIIIAKDMMLGFADKASSSKIVEYMQKCDEAVTEDLNKIESMEKASSRGTEEVLNKYISILDYIESQLSGLDIDGQLC